MEKTTTEILRKHFDSDNSVDEYAIVKAMQEYASQFQTNTDLVTTEICVLRDRISELEGFLKELDGCDGNNFHTYREELESLINKGNK